MIPLRLKMKGTNLITTWSVLGRPSGGTATVKGCRPIGLSYFLAGLALWSGSASTTCGDGETAEAQPNIVWLVTEDNSAEYLRLYESGGVPMPNVERLAEQGIVFNHAYANAPVCSVARSALISGCYGPRTLTQFHRATVRVPMPSGLAMFPHYLRQAGYYTTNNSKEDYNFQKGAEVWDVSARDASYRNRQPGQPFFHVQNFGITHEGQLQFTAQEMPKAVGGTENDSARVFPYHPDTAVFRYTQARYRNLHRIADEQIGTFLEQLEADGLMENTIIFYFGDHGGVLPGSKGYVYERGLQVPLVVYVPPRWRHLFPIPAGGRVDGVVQFVDFAPTMLNLAGLGIPALMEGRPFLGSGVTLAELNSREMAFSYADRFDEKIDMVRALRVGRYKYIRSYQPFNIDGLDNHYRYKMLAYQEWRTLYRTGRLTPAQSQFFESRPAEALYDLEQDPFELHDLSDHPEHQAVLLSLRRAMRDRVESMPDLSFFPESYLLTHATDNPVGFGQRHRKRITRLVATADLSLQPFDAARTKIGNALRSRDPWMRYWALIVCSTFGEQAETFLPLARKLAASDPINLVRMRAAEFLGLGGWNDPRPIMIACVRDSGSAAEATLVLNSIALLHDVAAGYAFHLDEDLVPSEWLQDPLSNVSLRFAYINGQDVGCSTKDMQ